MAADLGGSERSKGVDWREMVTVVLLSVTAIVTAWTGFQASKWSGAMSIAFSQASSARIEAGRYEETADRKVTIQAGLLTTWLQAYQAGDDELATFLESRFPEPLATAFPAWLATRPLTNPDAPPTPFEMEEYAIPETALAQESDARADDKFQEALRNNQRSDNYTVLLIGFATVLFFGALAGRLKTPRAQWFMLAAGGVGFVICTAVLISFPKLV